MPFAAAPSLSAERVRVMAMVPFTLLQFCKALRSILQTEQLSADVRISERLA